MYAGKELIQSLKKGDFQHKALDISIKLAAPVILIPENIYRPDKPIIVVDTGFVELRSKLAAYNHSLNYKEELSPSMLYDNYEILLSNFQINILESGLPEGITMFQKGSGS